MALNTDITFAAAIAALDALVDLMDIGTGNAAVQIWDGAKPTDPDVTTPTGTMLATIDLGSATIFGAATTGTGGSNNSATAACANLPKSQTSATAAGTATFARAVDANGLAIIDGSVATATADFIIDNTVIGVGQTVKLNSWKVKLPRG